MMGYEDIVLGITTYNRINLVMAQCRCLAICKNIARSKIIVRDDCSDEYDFGLLRSLYPPHAEIYKSEFNSKSADLACFDVLSKMVATGKDVIVIFDSDLVCREDLLDIIIGTLPLTEGIFSLLNAGTHPIIRSNGVLVIKESIGAAGCVMTREIAIDILTNVPPGPKFDLRFSKYLLEKKICFGSIENSAVQHLGFALGQNSYLYLGDFGKGFTEYNQSINALVIESIVGTNQYGFDQIRKVLIAQSGEIKRLKEQISDLQQGTKSDRKR